MKDRAAAPLIVFVGVLVASLVVVAIGRLLAR